MTTYERQQKVFDRIQKERCRQYELGFNLEHDLKHGWDEMASLMTDYLLGLPRSFQKGLVFKAHENTPEEQLEEAMLKAVSIGVAYLESREYIRKDIKEASYAS